MIPDPAKKKQFFVRRASKIFSIVLLHVHPADLYTSGCRFYSTNIDSSPYPPRAIVIHGFIDFEFYIFVAAYIEPLVDPRSPMQIHR